MSCIVGITHEGNTYIGGERAASDGNSIISLSTPKVEERNSWVYGYAGTIGIGQLLSYIPLDAEVEDILLYIRLDIVESMKAAMESFSNTPADHDTTWLIGREGRLFEMNSSDWSVIEVKETAIGSGGTFAMGSLSTSIYIDNTLSPIERIGLALNSAIQYSPVCQGPIDIVFV